MMIGACPNSNSTLIARQLKRKNGAGDGDRTRDIQLGKLAFYR